MIRGLKLGAAVLGTSVALLATALPAAAEPVTGTLDRDGNVAGLKVKVTGGTLETHLFGLNLANGAKLKTYCINIKTSVDYQHPNMREVPWDTYPDAASSFKKNRAEINWLLHNSYPFIGLDALEKTLTDSGVTLKDGLTKEEAIAGTQAAAWHFSDEADLDKNNPTPGHAAAAKDVLALYGYLTGAKNVGLQNTPAPKLEISPKTLAGQPGTRIGPFTVSTTASITQLTAKAPAGVKVVDKDGKEIDAAAVKNGFEFFFDVPAGAAPAEASVDLKASVDTGRVFVASDKEHPTQNLIVAQSDTTAVTAAAKATWAPAAAPTTTPTTTPAPQAAAGPALAATGASILVPIVVGVVLLAAGVGALLFLRRRRA